MFTPSTIQSDDPSADATAASPHRVRKEFLHAWNGYKQYAWGHDALKPLSKTYSDWYPTPLLMTPVDAFDTMILMGLTAEAAEAKDLIKQQQDQIKHDQSGFRSKTMRLVRLLRKSY